MEAAKDSAGIMREEMGKHGWNVFKGYKEGRKKVMEKHGELIIEHTAEQYGKMASTFAVAHGHAHAAPLAENVTKEAMKKMLTAQEKKIKERAEKKEAQKKKEKEEREAREAAQAKKLAEQRKQEQLNRARQKNNQPLSKSQSRPGVKT